jgi:hypothetical protein
MKVVRAAYALTVLLLSSASYAAAQEAGDSDPLPITVGAKPTTVWVGRPVILSGDSVPTPTLSTVTITVTPASARTPTPVEFRLTLDGGGKFSKSYTPSVAGTYQVQALAPDGRGSAQTSFSVQDPAAPSASIVGAMAQAVGDAAQIVEAIAPRVDALPANPAKDELVKSIAAIRPQIQKLQTQANTAAKPMADVLRLSSQLKLSEALEAERDGLLRQLAAEEDAHQHTKEVLNDVKNHHTSCDDLEVVVEGFKWAGVLLNFAASPAGVAENFARDLVNALSSDGLQMVGASNATQFGTGEAIKSTGILNRVTFFEDAILDGGNKLRESRVNLDGNTLVSRVNDLAGEAANRTMAAYCVTISGPVKATMHAQFYLEGTKWWEYSFDLIAKVTLHYPRDASGDQIPVNGRMEGFGTNFKLWENALTIQYPRLMSSTVLKKFVILPPSIPPTAAVPGGLPAQYSTEGSVFSALATPNAFFFQTTGLISKDKLQITVGAVRTDQNPKARVVAILVPALTAGLPTLSVYELPYKDAHFVFERTADNVFEIPLTTVGKTVRGAQHFQNERRSENNRGNYSVDITVCNPGC